MSVEILNMMSMYFMGVATGVLLGWIIVTRSK